mgnify:CR=1 FL=1
MSVLIGGVNIIGVEGLAIGPIRRMFGSPVAEDTRTMENNMSTEYIIINRGVYGGLAGRAGVLERSLVS